MTAIIPGGVTLALICFFLGALAGSTTEEGRRVTIPLVLMSAATTILWTIWFTLLAVGR